VTARGAANLAKPIDLVQVDYAAFAAGARALAEREFAGARFCKQYAECYRALSRQSGAVNGFRSA
jgi:hypothetical protein